MNEISQDHPEAVAYRHKCLGNYNGLCKIRAIGLQAGSCGEQGPGMMERECSAQEMEGDGTSVDHRNPSSEFQAAHQQRRRPGSDLTAEKPGKMPRTVVKLCADDHSVATIPESRKDQKNYTVEGAIGALQAIAGVDDDLLLDACDLLEDERKAKTFLALDAPLRKKWLLRKLRPATIPPTSES